MNKDKYKSIEDKYKSIIVEWINNKYNNLSNICMKYYPGQDEKTIRATASRLLTNVNFIRIKAEVIKEIEPDVEANARQCLQTLYNLAQTSPKHNDRILAATNYLKFTKGEKSTTEMTIKREDMEELTRLRGGLLSSTLN